VTNGLKILAESLIIRKIQYIVINYINRFVFDDEIEMKNRSTIQTLTFVQTNPDHLYMKLNMILVHAIIHSYGSTKLTPKLVPEIKYNRSIFNSKSHSRFLYICFHHSATEESWTRAALAPKK
jgi:hypothetical protein